MRFCGLESIYPDPITINLRVGWGEINGGSLTPGDIGQSLTNQRAVSYAALKAALERTQRRLTTPLPLPIFR